MCIRNLFTFEIVSQNTVDRDGSVGIALLYKLDNPGIELPIAVGEGGQSFAGVAVSNSAGDMDVCVVCCKYRQKAKCRTTKKKNQVPIKYRAQENTNLSSPLHSGPLSSTVGSSSFHRVLKRPGRDVNHPPHLAPRLENGNL
jgi:hypothetical protein